MIRIDDTLLEELGLASLPKPERDALLRQIYEMLEMRVGMRLAERMSDQQLDEFERFIETNDEAGALKWLESNFPDYKQVVADELEKLKGEIKKDSSKIIEAVQTGAGPAAQANASQPAAAPQVAAAPQQPPAFQQPAPAQPPAQPSWQQPPAPQAAPPVPNQPANPEPQTDPQSAPSIPPPPPSSF